MRGPLTGGPKNPCEKRWLRNNDTTTTTTTNNNNNNNNNTGSRIRPHAPRLKKTAQGSRPEPENAARRVVNV